MPELHETRYAVTADRVHIAYQVSGRGPIDLLWAEGWLSHVEILWESPIYARWMGMLGEAFRVIHFDKRGVGLSDRTATPDLGARMDDVRAVLDAAGSRRAVLLGEGPDGGGITAMYAATFPERVLALVLWHFHARAAWAPDYPWGQEREDSGRYSTADVSDVWGREEAMRDYSKGIGVRTHLDDPAWVRWVARYMRYAASPGTVLEQGKIWYETDLRGVLPAIHVPTLLLYRRGYAGASIEEMEYLQGLIPASRVEAVSGVDEQPFFGDPNDLITAVTGFVDAIRSEEAEFDRVLATVLFTDIVGSTQTAAALGDRGWRDLMERHHATVRALLARYRGIEVDTAGDGFFATFDGPARAVRCAQAIVNAVRPLGIEIRAGLHTGEVETIAGKVGGLATVIGARVGAVAGPSEVYTSQTVKDLTAGSGLSFEDAGEYELKGVPDRWRLYRVSSPTS
ncbi:MAG TPA: adenylate/guanylate cyclase domain-containing protein [Desulfobacteria bacterium]|nr:adenylate/guanylate cyclase domain-containing protein [Desulfobacteria bacterium]